MITKCFWTFVGTLKVAGATFTQRGRSGSATRTVKVSGGSGGGGSVPANVKLRSAGERTVQMEDYKDNDWADLIVLQVRDGSLILMATSSSLELVNHYLNYS